MLRGLLPVAENNCASPGRTTEPKITRLPSCHIVGKRRRVFNSGIWLTGSEVSDPLSPTIIYKHCHKFPNRLQSIIFSGLERLAVTANLADQRNEIPAQPRLLFGISQHATGSECKAQGELHEARRG